MANTKGSSLRGLIALLKTYGERARAALDPEFHDLLDETVISCKWYPEPALVALIRAAVQLSGQPENERLAEMGRAAAQHHFERLYADLARTSMRDVKALVLWSAQHDTGQMRLAQISDRSARYDLVGFGHPTPEVCAITTAYLGESFRITGAASIDVEHVACVLRGEDRCGWLCRWRLPED